MQLKQYLLFSVFFCGLALQGLSQSVPPAPAQDHAYKPLKLNLNESGSKYIRFILWNQFWARYIENNPGTADVEGNENEQDFDFALRRARLLMYAQISPRFLILTHIGVNNQSFVDGGAPGLGPKKPGLFVHDAWTEYAVVPDKLHLGAGIHYWNGISRLSSASTLNFLTLDAPIFNWPVIELTDQFARQFGIYAKGQLGKLDYRLALNKPFVAGSTTGFRENVASFRRNDNWATQGYFAYSIIGEESSLLPFYVGTYIGSKKILKVGAGFHHHPEGTASLQNGQLEKHNISLFGADLFYETPVGEGSAISFYGTYYNFDFGPNYVRNIGILNIGQAPASDTPLAGQLGFGNAVGNAQPTIGTGSIVYSQFGYAFPKFNEGQQLMPYVSYTHKNFEGLSEASNQYALGLNYFINGHNAKLTLEYSTRPFYNRAGLAEEYPSELILQTHIFL